MFGHFHEARVYWVARGFELVLFLEPAKPS
jgi:hypothetical protein